MTQMMKDSHRPVSLSEAARRFAAAGQGPSRSTLTRDAKAGRIDDCVVRGSKRDSYVFERLCRYYRVDPAAPKTEDRPATNPTAANASSPEPNPGTPDLSQIVMALEALSTTVASLHKEVRDLVEVRRTLMLKYDGEAANMRMRVDTLQERLRVENSYQGLSREITGLRVATQRQEDILQRIAAAVLPPRG